MQEVFSNWEDIRPEEAFEIQRVLAKKVKISSLDRQVRFIAGLDLALLGPAYNKDRLIAGAVVWDLKRKEPVERKYAITPLKFPYIPGLLAFRELPALLELIKHLDFPVDLFMVDGQGIAHPRRLGIASHLGVLIEMPTIGCAKSRLCGKEAGRLSSKRGSFVYLKDGDQIIGAVVRTKDKVKPLYVSVGHLITLKEAVELVLASSVGYRLPEPTRLAHLYVGEISRSISYGEEDSNKMGDKMRR